MAERLLAIGGSPIASMKGALAETKVKELSDKPITCTDVVKILVEDTMYWIADTKELIELAEKEGDAATTDLFTGYLAEYEKTMWMLQSYLA